MTNADKRELTYAALIGRSILRDSNCLAISQNTLVADNKK